MARAMPVLPLVASIRVSPGLMAPRASASLIMLRAGLQSGAQLRMKRQDRGRALWSGKDMRVHNRITWAQRQQSGDSS